MILIAFTGIAQKCAYLQGRSQQHRGFQPYHFKVNRQGNVVSFFKINIELLPFAYLGSRAVKYGNYTLAMRRIDLV